MLDIKAVRENPQRVKDAMRSRNKNMDVLVDEVLAIDEQRRGIMTASDALRNEQNEASREIPKLKKEGGDVSAIFARMSELKETIKKNDEQLSELEDKQKTIMYEFPNIPHESVPVGKDDTENVEVRKSGEPRKFDFEAKAHWDLGADLGIL
ncbi:MAG: serine--tRNA ligase, partial [Oscillospiraceae bacterium]